MNIWDNLPQPFFILAPMDDVTDTVFRRVVGECAAPDIYFTEFVNVDALQSAGREATLRRLQFTQAEHPLIAQIWGLKPENFYKTAMQIADGTLAEEANRLARDSYLDEAQGDKKRRKSRIGDTATEERSPSTQRSAKSAGMASSFARDKDSTLRFSGVDLNFGCPEKRVVKNGACSALMLPENEDRAIELIQATREGLESAARVTKSEPGLMHTDSAQGDNEERNEPYIKYGEGSTGVVNEVMGREHFQAGSFAAMQGSAVRSSGASPLPLSVKTRLGFKELDLRFQEAVLKQKLNVLSIHGRTRNQMSKVPADWNAIEEIRKLRDRVSPATKIVGNGDVISRRQAEELAKKHGLDGIMIGRGVFHDPFVFSDNSPWENYSKEQRIKLYKRHVGLFVETYEPLKGKKSVKVPKIHTLNKFCKVYISGFDGAKELRDKLMHAGSAQNLVEMLDLAVEE